MKIAKRKRDAKEKRDKVKTKGGKRGEEDEGGGNERQDEIEFDDTDPLAAQRIRLRNVLAKFVFLLFLTMVTVCTHVATSFVVYF